VLQAWSTEQVAEVYLAASQTRNATVGVAVRDTVGAVTHGDTISVTVTVQAAATRSDALAVSDMIIDSLSEVGQTGSPQKVRAALALASSVVAKAEAKGSGSGNDGDDGAAGTGAGTGTAADVVGLKATVLNTVDEAIEDLVEDDVVDAVSNMHVSSPGNAARAFTILQRLNGRGTQLSLVQLNTRVLALLDIAGSVDDNSGQRRLRAGASWLTGTMSWPPPSPPQSLMRWTWLWTSLRRRVRTC